MRNAALSERLREIADILEMEGVEYKPRAYRTAARRIDALSEDVEDVYDRGELRDLEGVGESIAEKIGEFLTTGEMGYYTTLKAEYPVDVERLQQVEGIGPKSVKRLYEQLGIEDLADLEQAARAGEIAALEGFGEQTQATILEQVDVATEGADRRLLGPVLERATELRDKLAAADSFDRVRLVGSVRRRRPTVGDVDLLATAGDPEQAMETFCTQTSVEAVLARGPTKSSVVLPDGLRVDLRVVEDAAFGAATVYFTGAVDHNVALRERALERDWKLNEYGLFDTSATQASGRRAGTRLAGETERGIYETLGLSYPPPALREHTGEVAAAAAGDLPTLVEPTDVCGDLHVRTDYGDGTASVREMAERAAVLGHEYVCIADHGPTVPDADGLDVEAFAEQAATVDAVDDDLGIAVFHSVEAQVTADGLGVPDEWAERVDLLTVGMHDRPANPTERLCSVLDSYPVDVIAHPLHRRIQGRDPIALDLARVTRVARSEDVALEVNARPERLDLDWYSIKQYRDEVDYVVSTAARTPAELEHLPLGVAQARRGWCTPEDVCTTRGAAGLRARLERE
ncbi:helix-hairpin-helix domain-containing protein [Halosegnis sp.]|uniref:helix-hairpin-helix domain-containing protein n=1 Tax=Halosegnis sp. TaxID=2864959 RepID=UPI0035D4F692